MRTEYIGASSRRRYPKRPIDANANPLIGHCRLSSWAGWRCITQCQRKKAGGAWAVSMRRAPSLMSSPPRRRGLFLSNEPAAWLPKWRPTPPDESTGVRSRADWTTPDQDPTKATVRNLHGNGPPRVTCGTTRVRTSMQLVYLLVLLCGRTSPVWKDISSNSPRVHVTSPRQLTRAVRGSARPGPPTPINELLPTAGRQPLEPADSLQPRQARCSPRSDPPRPGTLGASRASNQLTGSPASNAIRKGVSTWLVAPK